MTLFDANGDEIQQPDIHHPQDVSPEDAQLLTVMVAELRDLEQFGEPLLIGLHPLAAIQIAGLLQLALRHDGTAGDIRRAARGFLAGVREYFAECPAVLEVLRRGDDPGEDRPR
jgi:hypothetical protein